jgi:hypothetical protein
MAAQTTHPRSAIPPHDAPAASLYARAFWAIERHELVAGAADQLLTPAARYAVQELLEPLGVVGLIDIAAWADTVKRRRPNPATDDPETLAFLSDSRNTQNDRWHYVNLPLGVDGYDAERYPAFTRSDDVVAMTAESIRVLLGESTRFSKVNALRLVSHLVGDVHQPTHVGCCYLKPSGTSAVLVRDPEQAAAPGLASDQGGNLLFLPLPDGRVKLHEYWDGALGGDDTHVHAAADEGALAPAKTWFISKLLSIVTESADPGGTGIAFGATTIPLDRVAESWATDSLVASRAAYQSLRISGRRGEDAFHVSWEGQAAYDARCRPVVEQRLAAASRNLADLVNVIWQ